MTINVKGYAALKQNGSLVPFSFERRDLRDDDVLIDLKYCGICHSDLHHVKGDFPTVYPVVPGHEMVGIVAKIGKGVTKVKVGDKVGVGCLVDSCGECDACKSGYEQYCNNFVLTYSGIDKIDGKVTYGGYSENIILREKFCLKVPDSIELAKAAPLLCAGITSYSALNFNKVTKGSKVAIVGLGGLGHMAIKFAKAMGAEVSLFSRSPNKIPEAMNLGADDIIISTDEDQMKANMSRFDLIVDTVPYIHDINPYVATLGTGGKLIVVGYAGPLSEPVLNTAQLLFKRKFVGGSIIGGLSETQEMLDFCGEKGITPECEMIDIQNINDAYKRLEKGDVHYRFVIDLESLKKS